MMKLLFFFLWTSLYFINIVFLFKMLKKRPTYENNENLPNINLCSMQSIFI